MVIIAIIGILAGLLLPALGRAKSLGQRTACLSNMRQLGLSWALYSGENDGRLVESYPKSSSTNTAPNEYAWIQGNMQIPAEAGDSTLLMQGKLYSYNSNTKIYHCPTDKGVTISGNLVPSVRSYSMNAFMGDRSRFLYPINQVMPSSATNYVPFYKKDSDIPLPSSIWVMLDEDENTIKDGFFTFDPQGSANSTRLPAHRHNLAYSLNFADGHAEVWRFSDPNSSVLAQPSTAGQTVAGLSADNADLKKLGAATATTLH